MDKRLDAELNSELSEVHAILDALKSAGLIKGFALAVELPDSGHSVEGCCAGHMAEMLDAELNLSTGHVGIVAAVAERLITAMGEPDVTSASTGLVTLLDMGFREPVPTPREAPSEPVETAPFGSHARMEQLKNGAPKLRRCFLTGHTQEIDGEWDVTVADCDECRTEDPKPFSDPIRHPYLGERMPCGHFSIHLSEGECLRCMEESRWEPLHPSVAYWNAYRVNMGPDMVPVMLKAPFTDTPATWSTAEAAMAWMHNNYPGVDFDVVKAPRK